eukprot:scaffold873_cov252-Pinguiococcus_pyrenoidosus.AAC.6
MRQRWPKDDAGRRAKVPFVGLHSGQRHAPKDVNVLFCRIRKTSKAVPGLWDHKDVSRSSGVDIRKRYGEVVLLGGFGYDCQREDAHSPPPQPARSRRRRHASLLSGVKDSGYVPESDPLAQRQLRTTDCTRDGLPALSLLPIANTREHFSDDSVSTRIPAPDCLPEGLKVGLPVLRAALPEGFAEGVDVRVRASAVAVCSERSQCFLNGPLAPAPVPW